MEAARQAVEDLPSTPSVIASLRETARLDSTHYSNDDRRQPIDSEQVSKVIERRQHAAGRAREEKEVVARNGSKQDPLS